MNLTKNYWIIALSAFIGAVGVTVALAEPSKTTTGTQQQPTTTATQTAKPSTTTGSSAATPTTTNTTRTSTNTTSTTTPRGTTPTAQPSSGTQATTTQQTTTASTTTPATNTNTNSQPTPVTGPTRFELRPTGISRVSFESDAPLETIVGASTQVTGEVSVDPAQSPWQISGRIQVPVSSISTGIQLRDEHLRSSNWLDAQHHPNITFEITRGEFRGRLQPNRALKGRVAGRITIHGQTKDIPVKLTARYLPLTSEYQGMDQVGINADMLRVQGEFPLTLSDFGVSVNPILRLKVSNTIKVRVDLTSFRTTGAGQS